MKSLVRFGKRVLLLRVIYEFLWARRLWWLMPMITILLLFVVLLLFAQATPLGPFIYALF